MMLQEIQGRTLTSWCVRTDGGGGGGRWNCNPASVRPRKLYISFGQGDPTFGFTWIMIVHNSSPATDCIGFSFGAAQKCSDCHSPPPPPHSSWANMAEPAGKEILGRMTISHPKKKNPLRQWGNLVLKTLFNIVEVRFKHFFFTFMSVLYVQKGQ